MKVFETITNLVKGVSGRENHAAIAGGLLEEIGGVGGLPGLIQSFQQNGVGNLVRRWAGGQTEPADPSAIEQGLGSSALIDKVAQRTGVSADHVRSSLATVMPLIVKQAAASGYITPDGQPTGNPAPDSASLIQDVVGKLL